MSKKLKNIHPGEVLQEEFLDPLSVTVYRLAKDVGVPATRISEICHGSLALVSQPYGLYC